jgi:hypothetical protein
MQVNQEIRQKLDQGIPLYALLGDFDGERRWVVIAPYKIDPETGMSTRNAPGQPWKYRVRCFGLPVDCDYENYDIHEEYLNNFENVVHDDMETALSTVAKWLSDVGLLSEQLADGCPI